VGPKGQLVAVVVRPVLPVVDADLPRQLVPHPGSGAVWTSTPRSPSRTARRRTPRQPGTRRSGFHSLLCFLDRPEVAGGEALAGLLRKGNAGSDTAEDHITVLDLALAALPEHARPRPEDPDGPRLLARSDSAGATMRSPPRDRQAWPAPADGHPASSQQGCVTRDRAQLTDA
jgi:hypothetical protein